MMKLLNTIDSPQELKKLSLSELEQLAEEIRYEIINTVARTGGHLSTNLGIVELAIALHYVFDSPKDKIVWDVGHQCYPHKLLTGRYKQFHSLRQYGGISGFPRAEESPHDIANTGHGSTSISIALGLSQARRNNKESVVAVIGDGALTGGMAYEALNQAGQLSADLIVILNDNGMAISDNVGAISRYLNKLRLDPLYLKAKLDFENLVKRLPLAKGILELVERFKDSLKQLLVPGMLFEELGFTYIGPIDGHNIKDLIETLTRAKRLQGRPLLIHVVTRKGKGYKPAQENPTKFHSASRFEPATGELKPKPYNNLPTYTEVFSQTLIELAAQDERIVAITAAMPDGTGTSSFAKLFPGRFFDVGMAEQHAVAFAAGLAIGGLKPVVAIYSTFLQRAYDQILLDVCQQRLPVVFAIDRSGIVGEDGATHQGIFDLSYLRNIPNIVIMAPKDASELRHMLNTALSLNCPAAIRYPKGYSSVVNLKEPLKVLPVGKSEILRAGKDLCILAIGSMVIPSLKAAEILSDNYKIEAMVINTRFVKPLDEELIIQVADNYKRLITVEENVLSGGFGAGVLELLSMQNRIHSCQVVCLGLPDEFIEHGAPEVLINKYQLNEEGIVKACRKLLSGAEPIDVA